MRQAVPEMNLDMLTEENDLVSVIQTLQANIAKTQQSLEQWREEYKDLRDDPGDDSFLSDTSPADFYSTCASSTGSYGDKEPITDDSVPVKHMKDVAPADDSALRDASATTSGFFDCNETILARAPSHDDEYFEVNSIASVEEEISDDPDSSLQALLQKLRKARQQIAAKHDQMDHVISDVQREVTEGSSLRERIGMNHRSLVLLERKQEKITREAIFENVTSHARIRKLEDEVIQLRIRDSQHQNDIQRLMAENARLKLKLMEVRARSVVTSLSASVNIEPVVPDLEEQPKLSPVALPGLMDMDELDRPVCERVLQRGTMPIRDQLEKIALNDEITLHENTVKTKRTRCPLCNKVTDDSEDKFPYSLFDSDWSERSAGTSTRQDHRDSQALCLPTSINVMGLRLPLPLFIACIMRTIEDTMAMVGRVCFAEFSPRNPEILEFQTDFVEYMKSFHSKFSEFYRQKQD